ncbi:hypothetical protein OIV83_001601 [Microbotryomycetes sp. JL201]|nr:hypothetical protein OIV83_001601 [Microbotryomycetes sp. JL201]
MSTDLAAAAASDNNTDVKPETLGQAQPNDAAMATVTDTQQSVQTLTETQTSAADGPSTQSVTASPANATNADMAATPTIKHSLAGLPADIEHILSLGVAEVDPATSQATAGGAPRGPSELEQVVQELKQKAGFDTGASTTETDLDKVEQELKDRGVTRPTHITAKDHSGDNMSGESSDDSSDDSSDEDTSSDEEKPANLQAKDNKAPKKLRQSAVAASDDDDDEDGRGVSGSAPRTEHEVEVPDVALPAIDKVPEDHALALLGHIQSVISNVVVVKAGAEGSYRVLDEGTICCWSDRTVIGTVFETFGSVQQPFYSLRFPANSPPDPTVFTTGRPVHYAPTLASFVFTRELRNIKGTDASNIWDEEAGAAEVEFSDDEAEQEYRRAQKAERKAARAGNAPSSSSAQVGKGKPARPAVITGGVASLPARPATSYADLDSSMGENIHQPQSMRGVDVGSKPPSGRDGRRMFEKATGYNGEAAEFEFSDGSGDDSGSDGVVESVGARGGRGRGTGRGRGSQQRGRGQTRGRGNGRHIASLPPRPSGLPARPTASSQAGAMPPPQFGQQTMVQPPPPMAEYDPRNPSNIQMPPYSQPTYVQNMYGAMTQYPMFGYPSAASQGVDMFNGMQHAPPTYPAQPPASDASSGHFNPRFFANAGEGTLQSGYWPSTGQYPPQQ